jgi:hypothetical protein
MFQGAAALILMRNLDVPGHGLGTATNDVLAQAMVVGAPCVAYP